MISLIINGFTLGITKLIFATCVTTSFPLKINQIFIWTYNSLTVNCCSGKFCGFCLCKNKCPVVADILDYQTTRMPTFHRFIQWTRAGLKPIYAVNTGQPECPASSTGIIWKLTRSLDAKTQHNCQMPNIKFRIQFPVRPNLL
jgi:hypothetical protein